MKTLEQHNKDLREKRKRKTEQKAGVLCDKCETEMIYKDNSVLRSSPPMRRVICLECGFEGKKVLPK
jgi:RNase P subunit RPR2